MADISLHGIRNRVLKGITLEISSGELFVLVGPSGAGKTTVLNILAGLIPYEGKVLIDGKCVNGLPVFRREIGYLFQDLLLFPHISAKKNILMAMGRAGLSKKLKQKRVEAIMDLFHITRLAHRLPGDLSGGERQRVALARALVNAPKILLLDEPFSSLDYRTARYLRLELKRLQLKLKTTMLFVTHNLEEACELGNRIGVLEGGRLKQVGGPKELLLGGEQSVSGFLEKPNVLPCTYHANLGNGLVEVCWAGRSLFVPDDGGNPFDRVTIHPREVYLSPFPPPGPSVNRFRGKLKDIRHAGGMTQVRLKVGDQCLDAQMTTEHFQTLSLSPEDQVYGILKLRALHGMLPEKCSSGPLKF